MFVFFKLERELIVFLGICMVHFRLSICIGCCQKHMLAFFKCIVKFMDFNLVLLM